MADLTPPSPLPPGLARKRRLAQAALWIEQLWPALWPALGTLGLYAGFALLDGPAHIPPWPRIALAVLVLAAIALLLWRGLRHITRPTAIMADRRLERDSNLRHRPLATLADSPVDPTPEQAALWRVHIARLARTIPRLTIGKPRPGLARRDTFALRGALVVFLVASLGIAGADAPARLGRALLPTLPEAPAGPGIQIQAWITPPAYTALPPILLHPDQSARVPTGSRLTASVTGSTTEPTLAIDAASEPFRPLDPTSWQTERDLGPGSNGQIHLDIRRAARSIAAWTLTLIPDLPPVPIFAEPPGQNIAGNRPTLQTRLPWQATDDYGVTSLQAELRLAGRPDAPPLTVTIPLAGAPKSAHGIVAPDLSPHPWAGLPVIARLVAKDAPGQTGTSPPAEFTLPAREFQHPVARALIEIRRQLSLTPDERGPARAVIDAIADDPASVDNSTPLLLNLRALAALLGRGREADTTVEAQSRMWSLALALEENGTERTAQALEQARQALRDALDQRQDPDHPTTTEQAEIDKRMQELRDAIQKQMEALAEQARRDDSPMPTDPAEPKMNPRDLDKLAEQLQQSLKDGKQDTAKQQMAELEKLLDALKNARPETGEQREQRRAEQRQKGQEQMDAVQDMIQREGQVLDRSQRRAGDPPTPSQFPRQPQIQPQIQPQTQPQIQPQPAPNAQNTQQRAGDAKAQTAMRRALGELMQRFGDLTGDVPRPARRSRPGHAPGRSSPRRRQGRRCRRGRQTRHRGAPEGREPDGPTARPAIRPPASNPARATKPKARARAKGMATVNRPAAPATAPAAPPAPVPAPTPVPVSAAPPTATPSAAPSNTAPPAAPKAATSKSPTTWNKPAPGSSRKNSAAAAPTAPANRRNSTTSTAS